MVIRYRAPVRFGDTVRVALEVRDKEPEPGPRRGWVRFGIQVLNQRGELVSEGEWLTLMHRRRTSPRAG
jgi:acyl dehydratase